MKTGLASLGFMFLAILPAPAASQEMVSTFPWDTRNTTDLQITPGGTTPVNVIIFGAQNSLIEAPVVAVFCANSANTQAATFYQRFVVGGANQWETIRLSPGQCKVLNTKDLHLRRSNEAIRGTFTVR